MDLRKLKLIGKPFQKQLKKKITKPIKNVPKTPKIPIHFHKNAIITYSQAEIELELEKYPGLLKTLGHAYEYQIIAISCENQRDYWFCRNINYSVPLLKYINEQGWNVDWQEKPFKIC